MNLRDTFRVCANVDSGDLKMEFEPISTTRLLALMLAGGLFACVGLYMMLRPKPEGAAKIELFGLKFESSSAGLLVFVVGAAFLATPLFVPEKGDLRGEAPPAVPLAARVKSPLTSPQTPKVGNGGETSTPLTEGHAATSIVGLVEEIEPNGISREATPLEIGQIASGVAKYQDQDWFRLEIPPEGLDGHEIRLRYVSGVRVRTDVYDAREQNVGFLEVEDGVQYLPIKSQFSGRLFFRVTRDAAHGEAQYELSVMPPS
ncbi:hypothetical protein [Tateyamaria sp.]|uniref:hypothetical protein n=1 Tax=Tateyamaria sp. TaxID=1929288 RepID=UPI00329FB309